MFHIQRFHHKTIGGIYSFKNLKKWSYLTFYQSLPLSSSAAVSSASAPLSILPLSTIIRSLLFMSVTSSKLLLPPCLSLLSFLSNTSSPLFSLEKNPVIHAVLKSTLYKHFCAGETIHEIVNTTTNLRSLGYSGVILNYSKEVNSEKIQSNMVSENLTQNSVDEEFKSWVDGTLATINMVSPGDFVALKLTGAGPHAINLLSNGSPASPALSKAIDSFCDAAIRRDVRLLFDAERVALQKEVDNWSLEWMAKYNKSIGGKALVYGTYQAYLKATPLVLANHLREARDKNFTLGVKLVRGAYLHSDPRHLIHDTKSDTDNAYDSMATSLVCQNYDTFPTVDRKGENFPNVNVMIASHNINSVRKVLALQKSQMKKGKLGSDIVYAQLQGMADDISCELISQNFRTGTNVELDTKIYKYLVWGTVGESMKYLIRRAQENQDAVERTRDGRNAMWKEITRRIRRNKF